MDGLNDEERNALAANLDDLVREGPRTTLVATHFKKLVSKAGSIAAESLKKILVDVVSETAKKMIWPDAKKWVAAHNRQNNGTPFGIGRS